jgi:hypothetical protein
MITLERTDVMNLENTVRGMRNPMKSWDKSDSYTTHIENPETLNTAPFQFFMGENDLKLARQLAHAGSDDRKFLRQIFVSVDITAPLYWWKEYDTYKVGTVANSESTMHKIHAKPFTLDDFSCEHLLKVEDCDGYVMSMDVAGHTVEFSTWELLDRFIIPTLNYYREGFLKTGDKKWWWQMIQLLPTSFNQMRTCTLNYENLVNIYHARKNHKLDEWHTLCDWILTLPCWEAICL